MTRFDGAAGEKLPDTPTRRWAKTDATQQRILDAATDVFAARGFTAATMADIVDHSGAQALEGRQEQRAHRAPFPNTVLEIRFRASGRVCCSAPSVADSPARCAASGHNMFRGPVPPLSRACGISCLVGDVAEPIPVVDFRH
jgi:hypothetical protein